MNLVGGVSGADYRGQRPLPHIISRASVTTSKGRSPQIRLRFETSAVRSPGMADVFCKESAVSLQPPLLLIATIRFVVLPNVSKQPPL
jgi:hypothetical protein